MSVSSESSVEPTTGAGDRIAARHAERERWVLLTQPSGPFRPPVSHLKIGGVRGLVTRVVTATCLIAVGLSAVALGQGGIASAPGKFLVPSGQVIAIRAGGLFDSRSGALVANQTVLVRGDRIADVGPSVAIPPEARVIDLSAATGLPGT